MHKSPLLLASLLISTGASAQSTIVSPPAFRYGPGTSSNAFPFGTSNAIQRYQSIHDDMMGKVGVIKGLAGRLNENVAGVLSNFNLEVRISTASVTGATATTTFDTNHGPDKVVVVGPATPFNFQPFPAIVPVPPFTFTVPFTTPFLFLGLGGIAWETLIDSRVSSGSPQTDATTGQAVFNFYGSSSGTGCMPSGKTAAAAASSIYAAASGVTFSASGLTGSAPGGVVLGLDRNYWSGMPLPLDLPGTTGYPSGVCRVYSDAIVNLASATTSTGTLSVPVPITLGPTTNGVVIYSWAYSLDLAANGFGLVTTNGRLSLLGDGTTVGGCRLYFTGNNASPTGNKDTTVVITQFQF